MRTVRVVLLFGLGKKRSRLRRTETHREGREAQPGEAADAGSLSSASTRVGSDSIRTPCQAGSRGHDVRRDGTRFYPFHGASEEVIGVATRIAILQRLAIRHLKHFCHLINKRRHLQN